MRSSVSSPEPRREDSGSTGHLEPGTR